MAIDPSIDRAAQNQTPRAITMIAGVWLFISAFVWPHTHFETTNTWVLGLLCFVLAYISMRAPSVRYLNALVAIWLFVSAFAMAAADTRTVWNNAIVAIVVFVLSLSPAGDASTLHRTPPAPV